MSNADSSDIIPEAYCHNQALIRNITTYATKETIATSGIKAAEKAAVAKDLNRQLLIGSIVVTELLR